jgi:HTH-type transcriptional regulator, sugar sensing transcriptional regulator
MDISILKKLGLSDKEITIYLKLLEYGSQSVRGLAEISGLNRGTTYDILQKLKEDGLVSYYHQDKKQKFVAEDPEKLLKLLSDKQQELHKLKASFLDFIPELKSLQEKEGDRPITKLYEGQKGMRLILEDVLETMGNSKEKEYYIYSARRASEDIKTAYPEYTKDRIKKKIRVKVISLAEGGSPKGLDERRWLGTNEDSATFIIIYSDKCAFISRDASGSPVGVIIENEMIYETQKVIFMQLWILLA